jgi:hypothetical protein
MTSEKVAKIWQAFIKPYRECPPFNKMSRELQTIAIVIEIFNTPYIVKTIKEVTDKK